MTNRFLKKLAHVGLVLTLAVSSLSLAQESTKVESKNVPQLFETHNAIPRKPVRPKIDQRLDLARRLISQKNYTDAAAVLESMVADGQKSGNIDNLLLTCYTRTNNHLMAERLLRTMTTQHPKSLGLVTRLAEQLILLGNKEEAITRYAQAIALCNPEQAIQADHVLKSMIKHGLEDDALVIIDSFRVSRRDELLYSVRRGSILERRSDYAGAANEYYRILDHDTTTQAILSERRLLSMLKFPASTKEVEATLLEQVRLTGNRSVLKLLSSHYINTGEFDQAFELSIQQDSLMLEAQADIPDASGGNQLKRNETRRGSLLLQFILQCTDRNEPEQIIRMADYMSERLPGMIFTTQAAFYKADALRRLEQYQAAITTYESAFDQVLDQPGRADLLYRIGEVYMDGLHDYPAALASFDSVITHYPRGVGFLSSLQAIPVCHFRMGKIELAAEGFKRLFTRFQAARDVERHEFNLALVDLARQEYDSCGVRLERLVVTHPNGLYVNDAIELMMINKESVDSPEIRARLFEAVVYDWRRLPDSARSVYSELAKETENPMADFALYRLAKLELDGGDGEAAMEAAEQLIGRYEDSYFFPIALKIKADILIENETDRETATSLYRRILTDFPNYPFTTQVRKALRSLELSSDGVDQTGRS